MSIILAFVTWVQVEYNVLEMMMKKEIELIINHWIIRNESVSWFCILCSFRFFFKLLRWTAYYVKSDDNLSHLMLIWIEIHLLHR